LSSDIQTEEIAADAAIDVKFTELGLDPKILKALDDMGYEKPTPIQAKAIPAALQQRDVLGIAQTGTGKTGAFTLPTMHKLASGRARARMPRCLIVCPTRELAAQVAENVEQYGKYLKLEMALLIGGVSFAEQDKKLMRGVDILIATPGRLLDQFERGKILMTGVQTLVVDEADRMLDMVFSATMPNEIKRLVDQFLHQPVSIQIARTNMTAKTVTQKIVRMPSSDPKQKRTALRWLIENNEVVNGIVFCNRKKDVDIVAKSLSVHLRTETLTKFKNGEIKMLVASDVAARGLDVPSVSHVFNYDVPNHSEDYVHRIGRTGRAGRKGDAVMLVARLDEKNYAEILNLINVDSIEEVEIPGIEDFPKDGGKYRKGRGDKKDRGRGRNNNRDRHRGRRRDNSEARSNRPRREDAPKEAPSVESAPERDDKPKKSSSRRAAPKRKPKDGDVQEPKTETKKTNAKESKPRHDTSDNRDKRRSDKKRPDNKKSNNKRSENKRSDNNRGKGKGRDRNGLKENTVEGFGESMPAFFSSSLK